MEIGHNGIISKHKGKGYGKLQLSEALKRIMGLKNISLEVATDNTAAIALYHKAGFTDIGVYKNFWHINGVYKDAIVMQRTH